MENNRKAASGVHLGAEGSNPREKKKISARKQGLVIVMEGGGVVKYYRVNGTFSISSKDPFISINPARQARVGRQDHGSFALFSFPRSMLEPSCVHSPL